MAEVKINELFVPKGTKRRGGKKLKKDNGVCVHEAGTPNAPAVNHAKNQYNNCNAAVNGWHFTVDDVEVWQSFPLDEVAEHSGKREGNDTTVAIEIADKVTTGEYWQKAVDNAAWLAAWILKQKGHTKAVHKQNIWQHNDWSGKDCPKQIRKGNPVSWAAFVANVNEYLAAMIAPASAPTPAPAPQPQPDKVLVEGFVTRLYAASLDRAPDPDGFNAWVNALLNRALDPWQAARDIVLSDESIGQRETTEEWVKELYRALLGREPDVDGEQGWLVRLYTDMSRVAVVDGILGSAEFSGVAAAMGF